MALRQLAGLLGKAGGAGPALNGLCCSAGVSASSGAGMGCTASTAVGSSGASWRAWGTLRKRCFSSQPGGENGKSILDGAMAGHSATMGAAEQRAARIKATVDSGGDGRPGVVRQALQLIGRAVLIGGSVTAVASGYMTWAYETRDLHIKLKAAKAAEVAGTSPPLWLPVLEYYLGWRDSIEKQIKSYRDPTYDRLLPDPRPELKALGIKTLVLDLNDVLVSKQWTRQKGWSLYKRPGAQDFLFEMGQYFEVVIYTDEPSAYAMPVIQKLDKHQVVPYKLYRPETHYHEGKHVRDLSKLNRDLSQVLFISANPDAYSFQPENTLKLKAWKEDPTDTTLLDLIPMLQMIALKGVKDVRDVVRAYDGEEDIAKAFKKRMKSVSHPQAKPKGRGLLSSVSGSK